MANFSYRFRKKTMNRQEFEKRDGLALAALVRSGEVTAEELLELAIARIEAVNPAINAVVGKAYDHAREAIARGLPGGPFTGVPFLLKDLGLYCRGLVTTHGSQLFAGLVADHDSNLVARYKQAGLVILGKTNTPEFGLTTTTEPRLHGPTRNPWDPELSAGGSSGGAAAAVAARMVPMANASDGGGSIRIPSAVCGVFGMKPTRGRTPLGPDSGEGWSGAGTVHAITLSVRDSAALLDATAGPDIGAPYYAMPPETPYLSLVDRPPEPLRMALCLEAFNDATVDREAREAAENAAELCQSLGHYVEAAEPDFDRDGFADAIGTIVQANVAANLELRARTLGRPLRKDDVETVTWLNARRGWKKSAADYAAALNAMHAAGRQVASFFQGYDVLITPVMPRARIPLGVLSMMSQDERAYHDHLFRTTGFTAVFNGTGNPAMSVPLTWSDGGSGRLMPVSTQFVGRYGDEATLYRLAGQLEQARPWRQHVPAIAETA
jgi:amidase/6-aminohexanoate-cyclic-dimer hydrolase